MKQDEVKRNLFYIKMLNKVSLASLKEADATGEDYATTFKRNLEVEKKKRGQPLKSKEGKRRQLRINFSPLNYEFITNMNGNPHDFLNNLLDSVRAQNMEQ